MGKGKKRQQLPLAEEVRWYPAYIKRKFLSHSFTGPSISCLTFTLYLHAAR